jgi:23S rRNA (adenine2503-C2)-methyltransferase
LLLRRRRSRCRSSAASRAAWQQHFQLDLLRVVRVVSEETELGTTAKAILATNDGFEIECVRIPMGETETLCLSSQVGCRMGCNFCETGRMGLLRNLTAAEIVAEVLTVITQLGWKPRNLVFMGMGEALDNADQVIQALRVLTDRRGLHFSHERLTVCTSGHAEGIARFASLGWKRLNLAISLNAATDEQRSRIMPVNRRTPLAELQRILAAYPQRRNFTLCVNYCLMPGINDAREDARHIAEFCKPIGRVLVNLIPYNPGNAPLTRAPREDEVMSFIAWLREEDIPVRRRITKGRSIMAACGQLGNVALRRRRAPGSAEHQLGPLSVPLK